MCAVVVRNRGGGLASEASYDASVVRPPRHLAQVHGNKITSKKADVHSSRASARPVILHLHQDSCTPSARAPTARRRPQMPFSLVPRGFHELVVAPQALLLTRWDPYGEELAQIIDYIQVDWSLAGSCLGRDPSLRLVARAAESQRPACRRRRTASQSPGRACQRPR